MIDFHHNDVSMAQIRRIVSLALEEDLDAAGDITSKAIFSRDDAGAARVIVREEATVSGMEAAAEVCLQVDPDLKWLPLVGDGDRVPAAAEAARLEGRVISILTAERTLLNFLSVLSGVASATADFVAAVSGTGARIAATRKTTPGLRMLEKQAVIHGGGEPHRAGLFDAVLIKDNHIAAAGGIVPAVARVRDELGRKTPVEVEVESVEQLQEALAAGVDRVLLDNMTPEAAAACVRIAAGKAEIEASGGIDAGSARAFAEAGADIISAGGITRSAPGIDFSLEMAQ